MVDAIDVFVWLADYARRHPEQRAGQVLENLLGASGQVGPCEGAPCLYYWSNNRMLWRLQKGEQEIEEQL